MMANDFTFARVRLVAIYLLIIAGVITLFSFFVLREADEKTGSASASTEESLVLTADRVLGEARRLVPEKEVTSTEYEIDHGELYFTVEFEGETDVKGNLFTGTIVVENDEEPSLVEMLTDDFDEMVGWIGLAVFLLAALVSAYVANRTLRPIAESLRKQKQFISGAAHELRNPLAALRARIEAAERSGKHESSKEILEDLLKETDRLIALSERLLSIERSEERTSHPELCFVDEILATVLLRLAPLIEEKAISVVTEIGRDRLCIDPEDLETVLYNLIHNAIKFSNKNGTIQVAWREGTLKVTDNGVGIAPGVLPHIFERFYTTGTTATGTGLGLALVSTIVSRYSASVRVKSELGKGTEFSVAFPKKSFRVASGHLSKVRRG